MGLQRTIRSSSESSTVAFKIGMGHFHSQESSGCSNTAVCRLLYHCKPYFLGEVALLIKTGGKTERPLLGGTSRICVSSCREGSASSACDACLEGQGWASNTTRVSICISIFICIAGVRV